MNRKIFSLITIITITLAILPISVVTASTPRMVVSVIDAKTPTPATLPPDLVVSDVTFNPANPTVNDLVTITATITNEGYSQSSKTQVQFIEASTVLGTINIGRLKAGASIDVQITQSFAEGTHDIIVKVDPNNLVTESNENNNAADPISILVNPAGPIDPIHNVAITSLSPNPTSPSSGEEVSISVEVTNVGNQEESPDVTVSISGTSLNTQTITNLAAGEKATLTFTWTPSQAGTYTILAEATISNNVDVDTSDNTKSTSITVTDAPTYQYHLTIEIDWMTGHYPTQTVLDYMANYYAQRDIQVTYDIAATPVPLDTRVSSSDFWAIESKYNTGADSANGNPTADQFTMPEKWVLFGTTVLGQPNVVGYCYTIDNSAGTDMLAGNYIYIADQSCDSWAGDNPDTQAGAEAVVLMHEVGHSIGIIILDSNGSEVYCTDSGCVMSYLNIANAQDKNNWHYCASHWFTANLEYYN